MIKEYLCCIVKREFVQVEFLVGTVWDSWRSHSGASEGGDDKRTVVVVICCINKGRRCMKLAGWRSYTQQEWGWTGVVVLKVNTLLAHYVLPLNSTSSL